MERRGDVLAFVEQRREDLLAETPVQLRVKAGETAPDEYAPRALRPNSRARNEGLDVRRT